MLMSKYFHLEVVLLLVRQELAYGKHFRNTLMTEKGHDESAHLVFPNYAICSICLHLHI